MLTTRNIFMYLDRSYALQTHGTKSLWDLNIGFFGARLQARPELLSKLVVCLLGAIECERCSQAVDCDTLYSLLRMLYAVGLYGDRFELPFLRDSARFFSTEGQVLMDSLDTSGFLLHVEARLHEAGKMVENYLGNPNLSRFNPELPQFNPKL